MRAFEQVVAHRGDDLIDQLACGRKRSRPRRRPAASCLTVSNFSRIRRGDGVAVFAHQHEAQPEHDFALTTSPVVRVAQRRRHRAAADFVADGDFGHVADANRHAVLGA